MANEKRLAVEWVPLDRIHPNPRNPRRNEAAIDPVAASLKRFNWRQPIVAQPNGMIVAGHSRYLAAKKLGMSEVPVAWFEGSDTEAAAYNLSDNKTHEYASWDEAGLATILTELRKEDALEGVGFDGDEIDRIIAEFGDASGEPSVVEDPGPQEPPATPVSRLGDLWILGEHRLLCGDSTKEADVTRVMNGEHAGGLVTDPPYLVNYRGSSHPADHHRKAGRKAPKKAGSTLGNKHWDDYVDPEVSVEFYAGFLRVALKHLHPAAPIYQFHASRRVALVEQAWRMNGLLVHQTLVWVKARGVLTRSHFMWQSEPCLYGWLEGNQPPTDRRPPPGTTNVWSIDQKGDPRELHPTVKPLAIFTRPFEWHLKPGEIAYEPFSGSGTAIVAAEQTGRRCFALELAPAYVDAAVGRWQKACGKRAVLDGDGRTFDEIAAERSATAEFATRGNGDAKRDDSDATREDDDGIPKHADAGETTESE